MYAWLQNGLFGGMGGGYLSWENVMDMRMKFYLNMLYVTLICTIFDSIHMTLLSLDGRKKYVGVFVDNTSCDVVWFLNGCTSVPCHNLQWYLYYHERWAFMIHVDGHFCI